MDKEITIKLTQNEANAIFVALVSRLDYFDGRINEEVMRGNANNVIGLIVKRDYTKNAKKKLLDVGATLWY